MKYFAILVILCKLAQVKHLKMFKVGCAFWMAISSDFRMGKHRDDDHEEDAHYFTSRQNLPSVYLCLTGKFGLKRTEK